MTSLYVMQRSEEPESYAAKDDNNASIQAMNLMVVYNNEKMPFKYLKFMFCVNMMIIIILLIKWMSLWCSVLPTFVMKMKCIHWPKQCAYKMIANLRSERHK